MTLYTVASSLVTIIGDCAKPVDKGVTDLVQNVTTLFIGFILTTVVGTILTAFVQQRTWANQWLTQRNKEDLIQAQTVFEEVSRMLDRRLYWLTQFRLWTRRSNEERLQNALRGYRKALQDWNESINRNLAMLETYFGKDLRKVLDSGVGAKFVMVGSQAELLYRERKNSDEARPMELEQAIENLRLDVYAYNLEMLRTINERYRNPVPSPGRLRRLFSRARMFSKKQSPSMASSR